MRIVTLIIVVAFSVVPMTGAYGTDYGHRAAEDLTKTADDTATFDGGYGSTSNTSASSYNTSVPDVGEGRAYGYQDQDGNYHSND